MTREEAINVVRSIYQTDAEREALAILVPELRESSDEDGESVETDFDVEQLQLEW